MERGFMSDAYMIATAIREVRTELTRIAEALELVVDAIIEEQDDEEIL